MRRRALRWLLVVTLGLGGLVGGLELWWRQSPSIPVDYAKTGILRDARDLPWGLIPDDRMLWRGASNGNFHGSQGETVPLNKNGLRGQDSDSAPALLVVGGTCAFGEGVSQSDLFVAQLAGNIHRRWGSDVKWGLAALPGYSSFQGLRWLEDHLGVETQWVVLHYGLDDLVYSNGLADVEQQSAGGLRTKLERLELGRRLRRKIQGESDSTSPVVIEDVPPRRVSPEELAENLRRSIELIRENGSQPIVLGLGCPPSRPRATDWIFSAKGSEFLRTSSVVLDGRSLRGRDSIAMDLESLNAWIDQAPQNPLAHFFKGRLLERLDHPDAGYELELAKRLDRERLVVGTYDSTLERVSREMKVPFVKISDSLNRSTYYLDDRRWSVSGHSVVANAIEKHLNAPR